MKNRDEMIRELALELADTARADGQMLHEWLVGGWVGIGSWSDEEIKSKHEVICDTVTDSTSDSGQI